MADIQFTIRLSETLVERARLAGLSITDEAIAALLESELARAQAVNMLRDAMNKLEGSLTPEEIEDELARAKTDRIAQKLRSAKAP